MAGFSNLELRVRAPFRDNIRIYDGYDSSRDLIALYSKEKNPDSPYSFKVSLSNLKGGFEKNLDLLVLLNFGRETKKPWKLAFCIYDEKNFTVKDAVGREHSGFLKDVKFDLAGKCVEFSLDKDILRNFGWKDFQPLYLQVISAKDKQKKVIDSLNNSVSMQYAPDKKDLTRRWEDEIVYFAFTDRFSNADSANDGPDTDPANPYAFHGGDWQGIIDKLDYIKDLGCTCVWISPVISNEPGGYHAYWPYDFLKTERHFGTIDKLKELVAKAHEKGLKVIMDTVVNHTGYTHPWTKDPDYYDWFHHYGDMKLPTPWHMENHDFAGLPDLNQENPKVYNYLLNMTKHWIGETGCDGIRLDAAQNIPHWFWKKFTEDVRKFAKPDFLLLGEAFNPFPKWVGSYQNDGLDAMFDVPLAWAIRDVFAYNRKKSLKDRFKEAKQFFWSNPCDSIRKVLTTNSGNMKELGFFLSRDTDYDNSNLMVTFLDNHDLTRFMEEAQDKEKLKLALAFLFAVRGFPAFYFGTEAGMTGGGKDNAFRKDMDWDYEASEIKDFFKKLAQIRKERISLRRGIQRQIHSDRHVYSFARLHPEEEAVCIFNNSEKEQKREININGLRLIREGSTLKNLLKDESFQVKDGKILLTLKPKESKILIL